MTQISIKINLLVGRFLYLAHGLREVYFIMAERVMAVGAWDRDGPGSTENHGARAITFKGLPSCSTSVGKVLPLRIPMCPEIIPPTGEQMLQIQAYKEYLILKP